MKTNQIGNLHQFIHLINSSKAKELHGAKGDCISTVLLKYIAVNDLFFLIKPVPRSVGGC